MTQMHDINQLYYEHELHEVISFLTNHHVWVVRIAYDLRTQFIRPVTEDYIKDKEYNEMKEVGSYIGYF
jgi:hypothetical protein